MSSVGALPPEIITEVLSRLPVKSLCRFKSVSPSWNSLISDPLFAKTHLNRTKTLNPKHLEQKAIIISSSYSLYSVDFADVNPTAKKLDFPPVEQHDDAGKRVQVLSSCDGLLLVSYEKLFIHLYNLFLLNPCTRECKKLPAPPYTFNQYPTKASLYGVVCDSSTDDYKVVMLSLGQLCATMVDVYSLKTNAWRRINVSKYMVVSNSSCGVFFNGCLHRIFWKIGPNGYYVILAFNLSDEVFEEVPLPASLPKRKYFHYRVGVVGGCLCLVYTQPCDRPNVWMMKEYGVRESWTKNTLDLPPGTPWGPIMCLLRWLDKCLLYSRNENKLVMYDLGNETTMDMAVAGIPREYIFGATYVESLISPNHVGGIGRQ